jgi:hypothetical protein
MEKPLEPKGIASVGSVISKDGRVSPPEIQAAEPTMAVVRLNDKQFKSSLET